MGVPSIRPQAAAVEKVGGSNPAAAGLLQFGQAQRAIAAGDDDAARIDRKNLAEIAVSDPAAFAALVEVARKALPADVNAPSGEAA